MIMWNVHDDDEDNVATAAASGGDDIADIYYVLSW